MKANSKRPIFLEEFVHINGIDQYLFHCGTRPDNQVLLYLHGGPGSVESLFTHIFQQKWEEIFTVVHWDQCGAGKTLTKNPGEHPTIEVLLQDLHEVIQHLKKKYNQQKIVLLGHSWGSVLGSTFIQQHPEDVAYYIGAGQVICMLENERVGYQKVKELITAADDCKSLKKLEAIGEYPGEKMVIDSAFMKKCMAVRKLQSKYKLAIDANLTMCLLALKSPIVRLSDFTTFMKGGKANDKTLSFLGSFDLNSQPTEYQVPIYNILGGKDWQAPYVLAQEYFAKITAPDKKLYIVPDAGHMTMFDQPQLFFEALQDIHDSQATA